MTENKIITFNNNDSGFFNLILSIPCDLHYVGDTKCVPIYKFTESGERIDNITNWGLEQFQSHYKNKKIIKEQIFNYCYAVLHNLRIAKNTNSI